MPHSYSLSTTYPTQHLHVEDSSQLHTSPLFCPIIHSSWKLFSMASYEEALLMENGNLKEHTGGKDNMMRRRSARKMSSTSLRKKSDIKLISKVRCALLRNLLANLQEVILGTKLSVLFPAIPLAIVADCYGFARVSILIIWEILWSTWLVCYVICDFISYKQK